MINRYGGRMPDAQGVPIESIQAAIRNGVCKINVDTDSRMALTAAIRKVGDIRLCLCNLAVFFFFFVVFCFLSFSPGLC